MAEKILRTTLLLLALATLFCAAAAADGSRLRLSTTSSLQDSGLLDAIKQEFDAKYNVSLDVVSGGTGIAIQYGERGDVDVLIVHSPAAETAFMNAGHGWNRTQFAHNFFVIVGPANDRPASRT